MYSIGEAQQFWPGANAFSYWKLDFFQKLEQIYPILDWIILELVSIITP